LRQKKSRDSISHESPAEIPASSGSNSHGQLEFVHLGRRTPKGLFRQIEQSIGVTVGSPPNRQGGLSILKMN
jgi:hypothetical protein